ncbi:GNAT family N-acetyltransferase [Cellulomonas sp. KRMCY2]|uniref:GNAT family N-acetyltransferase n=1 Tax=Cellulomonas sp. KRMCY2 TaxID=1304865 RepID=UPI00045E9369|nr:GNAT family N-acetyltransferase [Cellulomonas sp. KRMCY2]
MTTWTITRAPVPADLDAPDAWAVHGTSAVSVAVDLDHWGHDDLAYSPLYALTYLRRQDYSTRIQLVAMRADAGTPPQPSEVIGTAGIAMPRTSNEHLAYLEVLVHPEHRGAGVGTALLAECERIAAEHGRRTLIASSEHPDEPAADDPFAIEPPTGSGRISAADPEAAFALHRGYALEQAERYSVLQLPIDPGLVERLHDDAAAQAGPDYRLVAWSDRAPDEWVDQFAGLETRMSTDAPMGQLEMKEDPWDVERIRTAEQDIAARGHGYLTVAAVHGPTGRLVAFTMVEYPWRQPEVVFQEDTLVVREHRGHRLGMLVKTDLLRRLAGIRPDARRIHTWNAEENAFMLGINVALGFRPTGVCGAWQKKLG